MRFAVGDEDGDLDIVTADPIVTDGGFHTVRAIRDPAAGLLRITIDGGPEDTTPITADGYVTNTEDLCVGAFADDLPQAFVGDIDAVALRLSR